MKANQYIALSLVLSAMALDSCIKLDTEPQGATITSVQKETVVAENPTMASASVNAINTMFNIFGNGNPDYKDDDARHDDYGLASILLALDSRGRDLVSDDLGYNWYSGGLDLTDRLYSGLVTEYTWNTLYNQIFATNQVAGSIPEDTEDPTLQYYLAQALAVRALDYFYLAQIYQFTYKGHESLPCVPIVTDKNAAEVAEKGCARSTVEDVYRQIDKDINLAVNLLKSTSEERPDKRYVSLSVALGIRARINLVKHNWAAAEADAQAVIDAGEAIPIGFKEAAKPGFKELSERNWLWGIFNAETDELVETNICNFPSHMGSLNYGYASVGAWRKISIDLYNNISDSDARKGWFLDSESKSENLTNAQLAYVSENGIPPYTQVKFAPYKDELGTATNATDVPLMRIEEMYLIVAEAQARQGSANAGTTLENFVKTYRDPDFILSGNVLNAVMLQRRIELWGEGFAYLDILRENIGLDRRGAGFAEKFVFNIPAEDPVLIFQIPDKEIQANPLISAADNNESGKTHEAVSAE